MERQKPERHCIEKKLQPYLCNTAHLAAGIIARFSELGEIVWKLKSSNKKPKHRFKLPYPKIKSEVLYTDFLLTN